MHTKTPPAIVQSDDLSKYNELDQLTADRNSAINQNPSIEKLRLWLNFSKFLLGTVAIGVISATLNHQIQEKELNLKEKDLQQQYLKNFIDQALDENLEKRVRFAQYFATLLKDNWADYYKLLNSEYQQKKQQLQVSEKQLQKATAEPIKGSASAPVHAATTEVLKREVLTLSQDINPKTRDFNQAYIQFRTNELELSRLGEEAFSNKNYSWTIKFLEQANLVSSSGVWQSSYAFLIGSYLIQGQRAKAEDAIRDMFKKIDEKYGYLTSSTTLGFLLQNFGRVRNVVAQSDLGLIDTTIDKIIEKKNGRP